MFRPRRSPTYPKQITEALSEVGVKRAPTLEYLAHCGSTTIAVSKGAGRVFPAVPMPSLELQLRPDLQKHLANGSADQTTLIIAKRDDLKYSRRTKLYDTPEGFSIAHSDAGRYGRIVLVCPEYPLIKEQGPQQTAQYLERLTKCIDREEYFGTTRLARISMSAEAMPPSQLGNFVREQFDPINVQDALGDLFIDD